MTAAGVSVLRVGLLQVVGKRARVTTDDAVLEETLLKYGLHYTATESPRNQTRKLMQLVFRAQTSGTILYIAVTPKGSGRAKKNT